jgi:hypothetical protein
MQYVLKSRGEKKGEFKRKFFPLDYLDRSLLSPGKRDLCKEKDQLKEVIGNVMKEQSSMFNGPKSEEEEELGENEKWKIDLIEWPLLGVITDSFNS